MFKIVTDWLRFFRTINLLMVALTMYMLRWVVLYPFFGKSEISFSLSEWEFGAMVFSTVLVTLGGYLINDYYDVETDRINRPEKWYAGRLISLSATWRLWQIISVAGGALALGVAISANELVWFGLYPAAVGLLWWYAYSLKKKPLSGNVLVSAFCGGVALLVTFSERESLRQLAEADASAAQLALQITWFYALFAFFSNLYRELLKDLEDQEGDALSGCQTVPIAWGLKPALWLAMGTSAGLLAILFYFLLSWPLAPLYALLWAIAGVVVPVFRNMRLLKVTTEKEGYHLASQRAKYVMLSGLLLLPLLLWESGLYSL